MHSVVCIKQVPDSAQIRIHPVTNTIMRQGVPAIINPYDKNTGLIERSTIDERHSVDGLMAPKILSGGMLKEFFNTQYVENDGSKKLKADIAAGWADNLFRKPPQSGTTAPCGIRLGTPTVSSSVHSCLRRPPLKVSGICSGADEMPGVPYVRCTLVALDDFGFQS